MADPALMTVTWYAKPNDLIGGWSVMTVDKPPSQADYRRGEHEVGCFMLEAAARRVAFLHNLTLPSPDGQAINYTLLSRLALQPHPLLNIQDDFEDQVRSTPLSWTGEVFQEARTAHHLLDLAGIPHGKGYAQDLDARTYLAVVDLLALAERLSRISAWHAREAGPAGTVGDYCQECGHRWPCGTHKMATDGTDDSQEK